MEGFGFSIAAVQTVLMHGMIEEVVRKSGNSIIMSRSSSSEDGARTWQIHSPAHRVHHLQSKTPFDWEVRVLGVEK